MSRKKLPVEPVTATIESLTHEGRGITHVNGKKVFVEGVLPGEIISFQYIRQRSRFNEARLLEVIEPVPERIQPRCRYFGICGGCSFQHVESKFQLQHKQNTLLEQLLHAGGVQPETILAPLTGPEWGYRRRARLAVRYVDKKQKTLVGFREKKSSFVADIDHCEVLHPSVGKILEDLKSLVSGLTIFRQLPQIEIAVADKKTALVLRHLAMLDDNDQVLLRQFSADHDLDIYLQPGGVETITPLNPGKTGPLTYTLPDHSICVEFMPADFVQVNADINRAMINRALDMFDLCDQDVVLDLYCGLGNFTLPVARYCSLVIGVEGDKNLVKRADLNARKNNIENIDFYTANLADRNLQADFMHRDFNKVLIDPPRTGAMEIIRQLPFNNVDKIIYISCNPATFARDAGILVREKGFILRKTGIMDMFPHTSHIESIALFTP